MNTSTLSYSVTFANESGDSVDHVFLPDERDDAIALFHTLARIEFAGFPTDDKDMDFQGYADRDTAQYGHTILEFRKGAGGNTTVMFSALVEDTMPYSILDSDSYMYPDVLDAFHEGLADKTIKANGAVAEIMRWNDGKVYAVKYSTGGHEYDLHEMLVFHTWDLASKWQDASTN